MAFCAKCGNQLAEGSKLCLSCGAPAGAATSVSATPAAVVGAPLPSNVAGLLTYILGFITGIFFLVVEPYKKDKFVRFHAFQSIFLSVAWIAFRVIWGHLLMGMIWNPFSGLWPLLGLISSLISLGFLLCILFLMYKAYSNERFKLPVIGDMAAKQSE